MVLLLWMIKSFILAIVLAAILAGLLHPVYRRILKRVGGRKALASGLTVFLSLILIIIPMLLFMGIVVNEANDLSVLARGWQETNGDDISRKIDEGLGKYPELQPLIPYQEELVTKASQMAAAAGSWVAGKVAAGVSGTASFFLSAFILLYALGYFLVEGKSILDRTLSYTPLSKEDQSRLLGTFVSVSRATLKGKLVIGILQGALAALSFWVAGIEGVFFWGTVMVVLSIIPAVGAALVWVPVVIFLALNGQMGAAIGVGLWCALVVSTIDNVLTPKLIGQDTQMPDLLVLLTTLGGLALFGVAGIVIGPIIGALVLVVADLLSQAIDEDRDAEESVVAETIVPEPSPH